MVKRSRAEDQGNQCDGRRLQKIPALVLRAGLSAHPADETELKRARSGKINGVLPRKMKTLIISQGGAARNCGAGAREQELS
jgi:hypothetical protein